MSDNILIDSNVWIYAFMRGEEKRSITANQLIEQTESIIISTQIVNEVCNVLLRKHRVTNANIADYIGYFYEEYPVMVLDETTLRLASNLRVSHSFAFWDSLVVASAIENRCAILYSEDMQHGLTVQGTSIINPFVQQ